MGIGRRVEKGQYVQSLLQEHGGRIYRVETVEAWGVVASAKTQHGTKWARLTWPDFVVQEGAF